MSESTEPELTLDDLIEQATQHRQHLPGGTRIEIPWDPGYPSLGGRAAVGTRCLSAGFDWDQGRLFLQPLQPVGKVFNEQQLQLRRLQDRETRIHLILKKEEWSEAKRLEKIAQLMNSEKRS